MKRAQPSLAQRIAAGLTSEEKRFLTVALETEASLTRERALARAIARKLGLGVNIP